MAVWFAIGALALSTIGERLPSPVVQLVRADRNRPIQVDPAERLNIVEFHFEDEIDVFYNTEYPRLERLCSDASDRRACRVNNLRPFSRRLAFVHRAPSETSDVIGELHAVLSFHPDYDLGYGIEFRPRDGQAQGGVWLASVGDWGYGIEVPGVRVREPWVQLFGPPLPENSWVNLRSPSFRGDAGSIAGGLVSLPQLLAVSRDGTSRFITPGSYLIERIRGPEVTFRREVASDFPCGEDVKPPETMPASLRTRAANLFGERGQPLFERTYSRGC
jgi:hypothetical protein